MDSAMIGVLCVSIPYSRSDGEVSAIRKRLRLAGVGRFLWRSGDKTIPYGIPRLQHARAAGYIVLVEGETDTWTLWFTGIPALGIPGAASSQSLWTIYLKGIPRVYLWHEPDRGGDNLAAKVLPDLPDALLIEPPTGVKDINELWLSVDRDVGIFRERMEALMASARPLSAINAEALTEHARELLTASKGVLDDPALLHRMVLASEEKGHADDRHNLARLHLALATAKQPSPADVIVKGRSSTGKNSMVDASRSVWPDELVIWRSGVSPKALAYSKEDFRNRFLVLAEANTLQTADGAYLIKSLISEKRIVYETVIEGEAVTLAQEGPTGMIATTTRNLLDGEMETRCWTLEAKDSREYNEAALKAIAGRFSGVKPQIDVRLRAGLAWLLLAGETPVNIPFAGWLAQRVPAELPESKRLFERLLSATAASAWLHQRQRARDPDGRIIANVADYAVTMVLFEDAFKIGTTGITENQRFVFESMRALAASNRDREMSVRDIGKKVAEMAREAGVRIGTSSGNILGYLRALKRHGYAHQERDGGPWQLLGDLPAASSLPHPYLLADEFRELAAPWIGPVSGKRFTPRLSGNPPNGPTPNPASNTSPNTNGGVGSPVGSPLGTQRPSNAKANGAQPLDLHTKSAKNGKGVGSLGQKPGVPTGGRGDEMNLF